jgi:CMP-N,N'-diacetyllegionaminic acid synthase
VGAPDTSAVAVVLARGGSKGLPRKNALPVCGRPCLAWTIECARASAGVSTVALSTDDAELAGVARGLGVLVVDRPAELAGDRATVDAAARHALAELRARGHAPSEPTLPVVILYGNVPVRPADLIDRALAVFASGEVDSVQSYAPVGKHHPWWTARVEEASGRVSPWEGTVLNHGVFRRQDLPPAFIPDGGVIVVSARALSLELPGVDPGPHAFFGRADRRRGVVNPEGSVIDIDTRVDLLVADAILRERGAP